MNGLTSIIPIRRRQPCSSRTQNQFVDPEHKANLWIQNTKLICGSRTQNQLVDPKHKTNLWIQNTKLICGSRTQNQFVNPEHKTCLWIQNTKLICESGTQNQFVDPELKTSQWIQDGVCHGLQFQMFKDSFLGISLVFSTVKIVKIQLNIYQNFFKFCPWPTLDTNFV